MRTGIIPFSAVATSIFGAVKGPEDLTSYETLLRSQSQAITQAIADLAEDLLAFLDAAP